MSTPAKRATLTATPSASDSAATAKTPAVRWSARKAYLMSWRRVSIRPAVRELGSWGANDGLTVRFRVRFHLETRETCPSECPLPIPHCPVCLLPAACCLLPVACCLLPTHATLLFLRASHCKKRNRTPGERDAGAKRRTQRDSEGSPGRQGDGARKGNDLSPAPDSGHRLFRIFRARCLIAGPSYLGGHASKFHS